MRIAGLSLLVPPVALPALAPFLGVHPAVQIEIVRELERRAVEALAAGRLDPAIAQETIRRPASAAAWPGPSLTGGHALDRLRRHRD